ncbi:unnamed protein product [Blepharisma stoltei]|uniref:Uncharacterized protein n=1 Tax=Blepharisma stoltei TaxID=1481888 RepID=A0AAU9JP88_9CILI|nr:unnamed protein product [Blepharisma stoltei]
MHHSISESKLNEDTNDMVLKQVVSALNERSLTLEECFRAADNDGDGLVSCSELAQFLTKLRLEIPQNVISKLLYILDEDISGNIEANEFYNCLAAYKVSTENHRTNARTYEQEVLVRFIGVINRRGIDPEDIFNMCDTSNSGLVYPRDLEKCLMGMNIKFQQKEIRSLMNIFDADNSGEISRNEFLRHMNVGNQAFQIETVKSNLALPETRTSNAWLSPRNTESKVDWVVSTVTKMESKGLSIAECFESIDTNREGKITLGSCYRSLAKSYPHLSRDELLRLLTFIDSDKDSIINHPEIQEFLNTYSSPNKLSIKQLFSKIALQIQNEGETTSAYFSKYGISGTLDANTFQNQMAKLFGLTAPQAEQIFVSLDLEKSGAVSAKYLVGVIQTYRTDNMQDESDSQQILSTGRDPKEILQKLAKDLINALKVNSLEPINIFRFADKSNKGTVKVSEFQAALQKLIPLIDKKLLKEMETLFPNEIITKEDIITTFQYTKKEEEEGLDQHGLTVEQVFWLRKLIEAMEKVNVTEQNLFTAADLNNDNKVDIFELKAAMKRCFPGVILSHAELTSILSAFDTNKNGGIEKDEFIQRLQDAKTSKHNKRAVNSHSKKLETQMSTDPVSLSPGKSIKLMNQPSLKFGAKIAALPLKHLYKDNKFLTNVHKILSAINPKTPIFQFFEDLGIYPHSIFSLQRLKLIGQDYQISHSDCEEMMRALDTHNKGYVYFYSLFTVLESHRSTMVSFPIPQNPNADPTTVSLLEAIAMSLDFNFPLKNQLPDFLEPIGNDRALDFLKLEQKEINQLRLALPSNAYVYHIATIMQAFLPKLALDPNEVMHCAIHSQQVRSQAAEYFAQFYLNADDVLEKNDLSSKLLRSLDLRPDEANMMQEFIYGNKDGNRPVYQFFTYFDSVYSMYIGGKIRNQFPQLPFNDDRTPLDIRKAYEKMANSITEQRSLYEVSLSELLSESELAEKFVPICKLTSEVLVNYFKYLKMNNNPKIRVYHFIAVLDSYRQGEALGAVPISNDSFIALNENIPLTLSGADWARKKSISLGAIVDKNQIHNMLTFLSSKDLDSLFSLVDATKRNFIYVHQIATLIDIAHHTQGNIGQFPLGQNPKTPREVKSVLQENAKHLDAYHSNAYQYYTENRIDPEESVDRETFLKVFSDEYTSTELNMIFSALEMKNCGYLKVYNYISCLESCCKASPLALSNKISFDPISNVVLNIPGSVSTADYFNDLSPNDILEKAQAVRYLQNKLSITQDKAQRLFNVIDDDIDDKVSGQEIFNKIDSYRGPPPKSTKPTPRNQIEITEKINNESEKKASKEESKTESQPKVPNKPAAVKKAEIKHVDVSPSVFQEGSIDQAIYKIKLYAKANPDGFLALESVFQRIDEEGNGALNTSEFYLGLERLKLGLSSQQKEGLINIADKSKNSTIIYQDFIDFIYNYQFQIKSDGAAPPDSQPLLRSAPKQSDPISEIRDYTIVPSQDFFVRSNPNITTILNSEQAALKRCTELLPKGNASFRDPDFGPEQEKQGAFCLYWNGSPPSSNYPPPEEIKWLSPKEWLPNPCFFNDDISSNDVMQGSLGDCWFIGALSVLATKDELLRGSITNLSSAKQITGENALGISNGVYPPIFHNFSKKGLYVIKFFKDCRWRWVIIDDRLPVFSEIGEVKFIFGHCKDNNELWVSLIEKAYAKLHGCYEALNGGLIDDGLVDLTGHVAEKLKIKGRGGILSVPPEQERQKSDELWQKLRKFKEEGTLMGCSIDSEGVETDVIFDGEPCGLLAKHAYAIIDVLFIPNPKAHNTKKRHRLLRLRNPWGQREWLGKWSDKSPELRDNLDVVKKEIDKLGPDEIFDPENSNDGTFLMCYRDWRRIFDNLFSCVDFPDQWWGVRFQGQWTQQNSGGTPAKMSKANCERWGSNPQYILTLKQKAEAFISLTQEDGRFIKGSVFPYDGIINTACFSVMKMLAAEDRIAAFDSSRIAKLSVMKLHREIQIRETLLPGKYAIIPSTMMAGKIGKFWLSIYLDCDKDKSTVYSAENREDIGDPIEEEEEISKDALTPTMLKEIRDIVAFLATI